MKKRTNLLALVLSITAITFTLLGCSSDTGQKKSIAVPGSATETGGGAGSSGTNGAGADQASADESINEQVLVDQDGIKITATEYVTDSIWGDGIKLLVENNSAKDYTIGCDALIVNDYMITDLFSADVAAGKKSIDDITIMSSDLEANGITSVDQVELKFHIYNAESYDTIADSDAITFTAQ